MSPQAKVRDSQYGGECMISEKVVMYKNVPRVVSLSHVVIGINSKNDIAYMQRRKKV